MQKQKRPFYIIGNNPNSIDEAKEFLSDGANALEPDIVYANNRFYVSHDHHAAYEDVITLEEYLAGLKNLLISGGYNLALLVWDMKDTDFDPTRFMGIVKENFSGGAFDGVAMIITHADDHDFLNRYKGYYANVGVGVDESNIPPTQLESIFTAGGQKNFTYADGITTFLAKPGVFTNIREARECRILHQNDSFSLIYTWVLSLEGSMRRYLDSCIDGIMVDNESAGRLNNLIRTTPYNDAYTLAENGYNPFTASRLPAYTLHVKTSAKLLAGTDARFLFTLNGDNGLSLQSLPFHSNAPGDLERGTNTIVYIEGLDIGTVKSLTIEPLSEGLAAGWLPETITVNSLLLNDPVQFVFSDTGAEHWITKKNGPVTKLPV